MFNDDKKLPPRNGYYAERRQGVEVHYTVTPIEDIKVWKAEQAAAEAKWQADKPLRTGEARCRAIEAVENQDQQLIADRESRYLDDIDKLDFSDVYSKEGQWIFVPTPNPEPKRTAVQKLNNLIKRLVKRS